MKEFEAINFRNLSVWQKAALGLLVVLVIAGNFYQPGIVSRKGVSLSSEDIAATQAEIQTKIDKLKGAAPEDKFKLDLAIGDQYNQIGWLKESAHYYSLATGVLPDNVSGWKSVANAAILMQDEVLARQALTRYLKLSPTDEVAWLQLIDLQKKAGSGFSPWAITKSYQRGILYVSNKLPLVTSYADYLEKLHHKKQAVAEWEQAKTLDPPNAKIYQLRIDAINGVTSK